MIESYTIIGLFGASLGSFINVCAFRIPRRISLSIRSFCPNCGHQLQWIDLIPVVGYLIAQGRCRYCLKKISFVYPLMEVVVGISAILLFWKYGISGELVIVGVFLLLMLLVAVIDWQHLIIPNEVLFAGIVIGLAIKLLLSPENIASDIVSAISASAVVLAIRFLGSAYFKKEAMGMGDVKLAAVLGFFLGWQLFLLSLWYAAVIGSIYGVAKSKKVMKIPFGSFLAATSAIVMIFRDEINQFLLQYFSQ